MRPKCSECDELAWFIAERRLRRRRNLCICLVCALDRFFLRVIALSRSRVPFNPAVDVCVNMRIRCRESDYPLSLSLSGIYKSYYYITNFLGFARLMCGRAAIYKWFYNRDANIWIYISNIILLDLWLQYIISYAWRERCVAKITGSRKLISEEIHGVVRPAI